LGIDLGVEDDKHHFPEVLYQNHTPQLFHGGDMATQELSAWAKGHQKRAELSQVRGRVQVRGRNYAPLHTLALKKVAARFNGTHLVTAVMHQVHSGTWETDIQFGLSTQTFAQTVPDIAPPDAAGLLPAIQGLHVGVVTKLAGDTVAGNHRVRVKIPFIAAQGGHSEGIWARLATPSAGNQRGTVFRPELHDEVILGFINNDPNDAVVLGALHSKPHPAPITAQDSNPQQGYFAKNGMTLLFDDDKKSIELKTKAGQSIVVKEQEIKLALNDNTFIKLSTTGIEMNTSGTISIKATGETSIKGAPIQLNKPGP
jgi:Rhs element Vgr protein